MSGKSQTIGAFTFCRPSQIYRIIATIDHHRNLTNLGRVGKIETIPILQICPRLSKTIRDIYDFEFSLVGKIWDSREAVKSPIVWDFSDI